MTTRTDWRVTTRSGGTFKREMFGTEAAANDRATNYHAATGGGATVERVETTLVNTIKAEESYGRNND